MTYDKVYELAKQIKETPEYKAYSQSRDKATENETNATLLKEYKKLSMEGQAYMLTGRQLPQELTEKLQKLSSLLTLSPEVSSFLVAEYSFNKLMGDVYKILSDEVGIDLSFLKD